MVGAGEIAVGPQENKITVFVGGSLPEYAVKPPFWSVLEDEFQSRLKR